MSDPNLPTPEQLNQRLQEFLRTSFGQSAPPPAQPPQARLAAGWLPDSPAARAGLREGDAVQHWVDGPPSGSLRALWARVQGQETIEVQTGAAPRTVLHRTHFLPALP